MRLDFLGTGAGNFRGSRRIPSSALFDGILLDCGAGATGRLHDLHAFDRVDAIVISHLHSDHFAGLPDFLLHTLITERTRPLTLIAPPGLDAILRAVFDARGTVVDPAERFEFRLVEGNAPSVTVGPWTIRGIPLDHTVLNLGYLVSGPSGTLFYSGDTRGPTGVRDVRADYLVHEATYAEPQSAVAQAFGHSTGAQAAAAAVRVGARRLFLNHIGDHPGAETEIRTEARRVFPDVTVVEDRDGFDL